MTLQQIVAIVAAVVVVCLTGWLCWGVLRKNEGKDPESGE